MLAVNSCLITYVSRVKVGTITVERENSPAKLFKSACILDENSSATDTTGRQALPDDGRLMQKRRLRRNNDSIAKNTGRNTRAPM
jgi:hypothetical protein